jgi:hypothetical protein
MARDGKHMATHRARASTYHERAASEQQRIALIGWGSLVYDPGDLQFSSAWHPDGPALPVEFCRQSRDERITLVLTPDTPRVTTLWATLAVRNLAEARQLLANREARRIDASIEITGSWSLPAANGMWAEEISAWAHVHDLDGAVWTALGPKFHGVDGRIPTVGEVVAHLGGLSGQQREAAERYVRCAPAQIKTPYRSAIEYALGWRPIT